MIEEYIHHNLFWKSFDDFKNGDPQLSALEGLRFVHPLDWWRGMNWKSPGIYILTGGRQIGKTTSIKLLIKDVLGKGAFLPPHIFYLPCDQIDHHTQLGRILRSFFEERIASSQPFLLVIDEVTYVKEWDRALKALADEGRFRNGFCIVTGSDSIVLKEAMHRFPGRRGTAAQTDFHLRPLDFQEYLKLVEPAFTENNKNTDDVLLKHFEMFLQCGGHLRAINDLHAQGAVLPATYAVFEQWIRGDIEKKGKTSRFLEGVLKMLIETSGTQVTYSALANRMGEITKPTFIDYCDLLERLDVFFSLQAFDQNRRIGFPKKAQKFHFWDPFIFDTVCRWLERERLLTMTHDRDALKAEAVVAAHFAKRCPTYYLKGKGEVDVVVAQEKQTAFLEVKWTSQLRPWDVAELKKHRHAFILAKTTTDGSRDGIPIIPLPRFLVSADNFIQEGHR